MSSFDTSVFLSALVLLPDTDKDEITVAKGNICVDWQGSSDLVWLVDSSSRHWMSVKYGHPCLAKQCMEVTLPPILSTDLLTMSTAAGSEAF